MNSNNISGYSSDPERKSDDFALKAILIEYPEEAKIGFGIGFVKLAFNWSFNRASKACYRALSRGTLIRCDHPNEDNFVFNQTTIDGNNK